MSILDEKRIAAIGGNQAEVNLQVPYDFAGPCVIKVRSVDTDVQAAKNLYVFPAIFIDTFEIIDATQGIATPEQLVEGDNINVWINLGGAYGYRLVLGYRLQIKNYNGNVLYTEEKAGNNYNFLNFYFTVQESWNVDRIYVEIDYAYDKGGETVWRNILSLNYPVVITQNISINIPEGDKFSGDSIPISIKYDDDIGDGDVIITLEDL